MNPTQALIEAAKPVLRLMKREIGKGTGIFSDAQFESLRAAISSARAAEDEAKTEIAKLNKLVAEAQADTNKMAKQRDEALRILKDYRTEPHLHATGLDRCIRDRYGDTRCSTCVAADALGGK